MLQSQVSLTGVTTIIYATVGLHHTIWSHRSSTYKNKVKYFFIIIYDMVAGVVPVFCGSVYVISY